MDTAFINMVWKKSNSAYAGAFAYTYSWKPLAVVNISLIQQWNE